MKTVIKIGLPALALLLGVSVATAGPNSNSTCRVHHCPVNGG
jgi:hypothetical protein